MTRLFYAIALTGVALTGIAVAGICATPALAQSMAAMHDMGKMGADHMHEMPATITSADAKTGLMDVTSEGMALKLHFPPKSLTGLKPGDKITLHLGFTKP